MAERTTSTAYDLKTAIYVGFIGIMSLPLGEFVAAADIYNAGGMNIWIVRATVFLGMTAALLAVRQAEKPSKVRRPERNNNRPEER